MDIIEELSCNGVAPTGPVSAWPQERNVSLAAASRTVTKEEFEQAKAKHETKVKAGIGKMASGLIKTGTQALFNGAVSKEIREERYDTCKACPFFVEDSKRCSECGCFMEAKTWVGGDPDKLCPKQKWSR